MSNALFRFLILQWHICNAKETHSSPFGAEGKKLSLTFLYLSHSEYLFDIFCGAVKGAVNFRTAEVRIGHNGCFISLRILKISILPTSRAQHFYFIVETVRVQIVSFCEITLLRSLIAVTSPSGLLS